MRAIVLAEQAGGGGSTPNLSSVLSAGNSAAGKNITNLLDPISPQDAATRSYVLAHAGAAQTPWAGNINGGGFNLTNVGGITAGTFTGSGNALQFGGNTYDSAAFGASLDLSTNSGVKPQTPWLSNIDADSFNLMDVGSFNASHVYGGTMLVGPSSQNYTVLDGTTNEGIIGRTIGGGGWDGSGFVFKGATLFPGLQIGADTMFFGNAASNEIWLVSSTDGLYNSAASGHLASGHIVANTDLTVAGTLLMDNTGFVYGLTPVADGTYTLGLGVTNNGTITVLKGIITAVQEAS